MLYWQFDYPGADLNECDECKDVRVSRLPCPECPFSFRPDVDAETGFFISAYNKMQQAKEYGLAKETLDLLGIDSEFKYLNMLDIFEEITSIFREKAERDAEKLRRKNGY